MSDLVQGLCLGTGFTLLVLAILARGFMGIAMARSSGDSFESALAWVLVSPLAILGIYLIRLAAINTA